jgi:hypothetical protein
MTSERKTLKVFFHAWLTHMHQLVTFSELSNYVDTTGTGSMRVVAIAELQSLTAVQRRFRTEYVWTSTSYMKKHSVLGQQTENHR